MVTTEEYSELAIALDAKTANAFGYQWKIFKGTFKKNEQEFLSYISPLLTKDIFRDKVILDAGCGGGKFSSLVADYGAKRIIGVDFSESCSIARQFIKHVSNVDIIQSDLNRLPFKDSTFDIIFSIGVLHHLSNPQEGFINLVKKLNKNGVIFIWVYAKEGNLLFIRFIDPIRKHITSKLPYKINEFFAKFITCFLWAIIKFIYLPIKKTKYLGKMFLYLPYNEYFLYFYGLGFNLFFATIFDKIIPPIVHYHSKDEIKAWLENAQMEKVDIWQRNKNSWCIYTKKNKEQK